MKVFGRNEQSNFIFVKPKPRQWERDKRLPKLGKYDKAKYAQDKAEIEARNLEEQVSSTLSSASSKKVRDTNVIYFIVEAEELKGQRLYAALKELSATVHAYLDTEHRVLLVSASGAMLAKYSTQKLPMKVKAPILRFRPLELKDQVSTDMEIGEESEVVLHLIPNLDLAVASKYLENLTIYLKEKNCKILWTPPAEDGMLVARMNKPAVFDVLSNSNVLFKAHRMPVGIIAGRRSPSRRLQNEPTLSSVASQPAGEDLLPLVCVADTGVNFIPQLNQSIVVKRDGLGVFTNQGDEHAGEGHGTPIACLVAFGEGQGKPRARIISFKIYSDAVQKWALRGTEEALRTYGHDCRIFVSSVNFSGNALGIYAKIDELIQQLNVCYVSSTGNIPLGDIPGIAYQYPHYIPTYNVLHLAQNANVIGVGAIARKHNGNCIAPNGGLSPFTRCGETLPELFDVKKPDLVENGGNMTFDGAWAGLGLSSFTKDGQPTGDLAGTSFSAPLIAGRLAEIEYKYGGRIRNAETLKAILFMSCLNLGNDCTGLGVPDSCTQSRGNEATLVCEGAMPLSDLTLVGKERRYTDRITVIVPSGVRTIHMCIVHSDDYLATLEPSLDTYIHVDARKSGRPSGAVQPVNREQQNARTYVKKLTWTFQIKDMGGTWTFEIIPESTKPIDPAKRKEVIVRYGCVVRLEAPDGGLISLTDRVMMEMKRYASVQTDYQ